MSYDEFDDVSGAGVKPRHPLWTIVPILLILVIVGALVWWAYPQARDMPADESVPLLQADAEPWKTAPEDAGGMDIPHRESTVFETLQAERAAQGTPRIESLLPPPEEPLPREERFAGLKTEPVSADLTAETPAAEETQETKPTVDAAQDIEKVMASLEESEAKSEPEPQQELEPVKPEPVKPAPEKPAPEQAMPDKTAPAAGASAASATPDGTHVVQIASLTSRADAERGWAAAQKKHGVLADQPHRIERADLGAKGVYYRVLAGPFSKAKADQICTAIKQTQPGGCLVRAN